MIEDEPIMYEEAPVTNFEPTAVSEDAPTLIHDWQYGDNPMFPNSIFRVWSDGKMESTTDQREDIIAWLKASKKNKILPAPIKE